MEVYTPHYATFRWLNDAEWHLFAQVRKERDDAS